MNTFTYLVCFYTFTNLVARKRAITHTVTTLTMNVKQTPRKRRNVRWSWSSNSLQLCASIMVIQTMGWCMQLNKLTPTGGDTVRHLYHSGSWTWTSIRGCRCSTWVPRLGGQRYYRRTRNGCRVWDSHSLWKSKCPSCLRRLARRYEKKNALVFLEFWVPFPFLSPFSFPFFKISLSQFSELSAKLGFFIFQIPELIATLGKEVWSEKKHPHFFSYSVIFIILYFISW